MIRPHLASTMYFWQARLIRNAPRRWTPITVSQSLSVILNSRLSRITPALLTSTAGGPSRPAIASTAAASARPPAEVIAPTVPAQSSSFRSMTATARPSAASLLAIAAPIPRAPPGTTATRCACPVICIVPSLDSSDRGERRPGPARPPGRPARGRARRRGPPSAQVPAQLAAGQRALVHLIRPVGEPQAPGARPCRRQREVLADPRGAMDLDRLVDHPFGHRRDRDLDRLDLGVRALVADRVHEPRGLQDQQPGLLDPHPGLRDPVLHHSLVRERPAPRDPARRTAAEQLERPLGRADQPHAVVDAARAEPGLGDREPVALAGDQVRRRDPDVAELDLGMTAVGGVA